MKWPNDISIIQDFCSILSTPKNTISSLETLSLSPLAHLQSCLWTVIFTEPPRRHCFPTDELQPKALSWILVKHFISQKKILLSFRANCWHRMTACMKETKWPIFILNPEFKWHEELQNIGKCWDILFHLMALNAHFF